MPLTTRFPPGRFLLSPHTSPGLKEPLPQQQLLAKMCDFIISVFSFGPVVTATALGPLQDCGDWEQWRISASSCPSGLLEEALLR